MRLYDTTPSLAPAGSASLTSYACKAQHVLPAPVLLKERSKSSVVRANPAGVFGVPNACGFGDFGVRGVRLGSVGVCVANRFATAVSCA